jgi:DNA-binding NtrC family response regulator/predicted TIM-barrel enzyme
MRPLQNLVKTNPGRNQPVVAVVAGSGLVASCAVEAGADILMVLNAGLYRSLGAGSLAAFLPYGNANDQTETLLREQILPRAKGVPIVAGVFAADETVGLETRLRRLRGLGVEGVVNWPAIGFLDGRFREAVEEEGLGTRCEAKMLVLARSMGFVAFGFALTPQEVACFLEAGVEGLILDLGLTRDVADVRQRRDQLQTAIVRLNGMLAAAEREAPGRLCLAFGGPITTPEDLEQVFRYSEIHGFAGGSVFERLPVQSVLTSTVRRFKSVAIGRGENPDDSGLDALIGRSAAMQEVFQLIRQVAPYDVNVCIEGETGTGKELVAMQLHRLSNRASGPFITLNCGAIPETLLESELFGHEKGAFTSADRRRLGKFELAQGGTLFLDEIADLSPRGQVALLRAIQQREITRVGGDRSLAIDVRIIAASNQSLREAVRKNRFREDLYYRLNYITISVPPLRDRLGDLPLLARDILARLEIQLDRKRLGLSSSFHEKMSRHCWPGNVRELEHVLGQAALREERSILEGRHFTPFPLQAEHDRRNALHDDAQSPLDRKTRARQALAQMQGNKSRAAAALGITRKTLYAWLRSVEQRGEIAEDK